MFKAILLLVVGATGFWFSLKHLRRSVLEIKSKPKGSHRFEDKAFNYPLTFLWFGYLLLFFAGLIVNNLILK
jgi:hypothetical protein